MNIVMKKLKNNISSKPGSDEIVAEQLEITTLKEMVWRPLVAISLNAGNFNFYY